MDVCEALLRRGILQEKDRVLIEDLLWRASRGFDGELRADHFWEDLQLTMPHLLFHNYETVKVERFRHQMDTVFICERFVLIIDLKHIAGEISYNAQLNQLLRVANGQTLSLGDPFSQVMRHEAWMNQLLWEVGIELPIITAVIVTTNSSILGQMPERFHIFKLPGLRMKLRDWLEAYPVQIDKNMLQLLHKEMLLRHRPHRWQHPLQELKIRHGALCVCGEQMIYKNGRFVCGYGHRSREALSRALHDYRLLVNEWITNKAFREFFGIGSSDVANKILQRSGFESEGITKSKRYLIPPNLWRSEEVGEK